MLCLKLTQNYVWIEVDFQVEVDVDLKVEVEVKMEVELLKKKRVIINVTLCQRYLLNCV